MPHRAQYYERPCKSALNRVEGMHFQWSLNPYRGCVHECRYCFARPTHRYFELGMGQDFARVIFVKSNLPDVLARELSRRTWRREVVAIGTATDPYQPIEGRYRLTRRALKILAAFRTPVSIVTKGTMVRRDLDVLEELTRVSDATVCFSIPTVDTEIWRCTEPGTPPPMKRLETMERLVERGVRAGVLMAPLLPGLSAMPASIERTVHAAAEHGAAFIGTSVLHLGPALHDYFVGFLASEYPELVTTYDELYGLKKYAPDEYREHVERRVDRAKRSARYVETEPRWMEPPPTPLQQPLPLFGLSDPQPPEPTFEQQATAQRLSV